MTKFRQSGKDILENISKNNKKKFFEKVKNFEILKKNILDSFWKEERIDILFPKVGDSLITSLKTPYNDIYQLIENYITTFKEFNEQRSAIKLEKFKHDILKDIEKYSPTVITLLNLTIKNMNPRRIFKF